MISIIATLRFLSIHNLCKISVIATLCSCPSIISVRVLLRCFYLFNAQNSLRLSWLQAQHLAFRTDFWLSLGQGPFHNLHRAVFFFLGTTRIFVSLSLDAWKNFKIIKFFAFA